MKSRVYTLFSINTFTLFELLAFSCSPFFLFQSFAVDTCCVEANMRNIYAKCQRRVENVFFSSNYSLFLCISLFFCTSLFLGISLALPPSPLPSLSSSLFLSLSNSLSRRNATSFMLLYMLSPSFWFYTVSRLLSRFHIMTPNNQREQQQKIDVGN